MQSKHSLKMFDGHEDLQANITNDAFLFAQVMMEEAKKNYLTRQQFISEAATGRPCDSTGGRRRRSR